MQQIELQNRVNFIQQQLDNLGKHFGFNSKPAIKKIFKAMHLCHEVEKAVENVDGFLKKTWSSPADFGLFRLALFVLAQHLNAKNIIETGVLHGFTSLLLLEALESLNGGKLISIDLPSVFGQPPSNKDGYHDTLPKNCKTGWVVPDRLKHNWDLRIGRSSNVFPTLNPTKKIDLFLHDSEHTYDTMIFEFRYAWTVLRSGGMLVVDNVEANNSLSDFSIEVNRSVYYMPADKIYSPNESFKSRVGIILK